MKFRLESVYLYRLVKLVMLFAATLSSVLLHFATDSSKAADAVSYLAV